VIAREIEVVDIGAPAADAMSRNAPTVMALRGFSAR
jgi:hypothetical protein